MQSGSVATSANRLLSPPVVLFAALSVANLSNYGYHLVMTRLLEPEAYGALGALFGMLLILGVPTGAIQAVIARRASLVAERPDALRALVNGSLRQAIVAGCGLMAVMTLASPLVKAFFHVPSTPAVLLTAAFLLPTAVAPVARAALQGTHRLRSLGASLLLSALFKLVLGAAFVSAGFGLEGALAGAVLGEVAGLLFAIVPLRRVVTLQAVQFDPRPVLREVGRATFTLGGYWVLISADLLLVRHYHPTEVSGRYAAATLLGRAVLFLPAAVTMAVYPRFARQPGSPETRALLIRSLGVVAGLSTAATAGVLLFPSLAARLFGSEYVGRGAVGGTLAVAMICFGVVGLLIHYRLATGRPPLKSLAITLAVEVLAIVAVKGEPLPTALIVLGCGVLLMGVFLTQTLPRRQVDLTVTELWQEPDSAITLTVVTPCYNGSSHIAGNLSSLRAALAGRDISSEIILVSDGSTDATPQEASRAACEGLRVIHYEQNRGKGFALRTGLAHAKGTFVAFIDSDGDLDPGDLPRFLDLMQLYKADLVVGSKRHPLSEVQYPVVRRVMSWGYHLLVRVLFGIKVRDTQTGIKLIRRDLLAEVLPRMVEKRFAFDLELLVAARRLGYKRILEAPVTLKQHFGSTVSARAVRGVLQDTAAIWYRRFVLHWYDYPLPKVDQFAELPPLMPAGLDSSGT